MRVQRGEGWGEASRILVQRVRFSTRAGCAVVLHMLMHQVSCVFISDRADAHPGCPARLCCPEPTRKQFPIRLRAALSGWATRVSTSPAGNMSRWRTRDDPWRISMHPSHAPSGLPCVHPTHPVFPPCDSHNLPSCPSCARVHVRRMVFSGFGVAAGTDTEVSRPWTSPEMEVGPAVLVCCQSSTVCNSMSPHLNRSSSALSGTPKPTV